MGHRREQVQTVSVTTEAIMRTSAFRKGVEDKRSGRSPNFDCFVNREWEYERGRQFASLAPVTMPVWIDGKLNPKAVRLYQLAASRSYIR